MPARPGSGRKKVHVTNLFKEVESKSKIPRVKCTFCATELAKAGSRMKKHILSCKKCPDLIKEKYNLSQSRAGTIGTNSTSSLNIDTPTGSQKKLKTFIDQMNPTEQDKANELLARSIYASGSSLSIMENPFWLDFLSFLRPAYKVPTRYELAEPLLQKEYEKVSASVCEQIASAESVALMCDGWTNIRNEPIVNFVVTTPSPLLYKVLPTGKESHTAEYMAKEMNSVIQEVGAQKVFGLVTDNAANMKAAWKILKNLNNSTNLFTYGCIAHTLNLLFTDLKNFKTLNSFLRDAISAIKEIRNSHKLREIFNEKQIQDNPVTLKLPVPTRWGSIVHCLDSLYQNKQAIKLLAVEEEAQETLKKHPIIKKIAFDETFWNETKGFLELLKPIAIAITSIESNKPQISHVLEMFKKLEVHFQETLPHCPLSELEENRVKEIFAKRKDFGINEVHNAANLLDPTLRGDQLTPDEQTDATETIFNAAIKMQGVDENAVLVDLANYRAKDGFFSKPFLWTSVSKVTPITWWKGLCTSQELSKLAVRFLALPATSAACERSFSTYGGIHTKKRNRLKNERAAKIVYIAYNLKLKHQDRKTKHDVQITIPQSFTSQPSCSQAIFNSEPSSSFDMEPGSTPRSARTSQNKARRFLNLEELEQEDEYEESEDSDESFSLHDSSDDTHWSMDEVENEELE